MKFLENLLNRLRKQVADPEMSNRLARDLFEGLFARRSTLTPGQIIHHLTAIHDLFDLPAYGGWDGQGRDRWAYTLLDELVRSPALRPRHIPAMVQLLTWRELESDGDFTCRMCILRAVERYPSRSLLPPLRKHKKHLLRKRVIARPRSQHYAGIGTELELVSKLIETSWHTRDFLKVLKGAKHILSAR